MPQRKTTNDVETGLDLSPIEISTTSTEPETNPQAHADPKVMEPELFEKSEITNTPKKTRTPSKTLNEETILTETRTFKPLRRHMPSERQSVTHKFSLSGHEGFLTIGLYEDGRPGEIFITMNKEGSFVSGLLNSFATSISLSLQYGIPLKELVHKFSNVKYEPAGLTDNSKIPVAKSIVDYIFRYLAIKFLPTKDWQSIGLTISPEELAEITKNDQQKSAVDSKKQIVLNI